MCFASVCVIVCAHAQAHVCSYFEARDHHALFASGPEALQQRKGETGLMAFADVP